MRTVITRTGPFRNSFRSNDGYHLATTRESTSRGHGTAGRSGPPGNENARTHGTHSLKRAVQVLGNRVINRRTKVGRALAGWRAELLADLGGIEAVSTQEAPR